MTTPAPTQADKIKCEIDGAMVHSIQLHLRSNHPEVSIEDYKTKYPGFPLLSPFAEARVAEQAAAKDRAAKETEINRTPVAMATEAPGMNVTSLVKPGSVTKQPLHEVFGLGKVKAAMSSRGEPIPITVLTPPTDPESIARINKKNDTYVYEEDELKNLILALELEIPAYIWGHKGTGKSELVEQICARTCRPSIRVQHTINTEESHIIGNWIVKKAVGPNGDIIPVTEYNLGPLPMAMKYGWLYLADEYDFALPSVTSVYQAVLEGKALVIKDADVENRVIEPHPNFRFVATGNTNGSGDETGLYQGTNLQNSANFDRFGMVIHKRYMDKAAETKILEKRLSMTNADAGKLVQFAGLVREAYDGGKISETISPRTLIYAATIGIKRGSFSQGVSLSFINKLCRVDAEAVSGMAQRVFG